FLSVAGRTSSTEGMRGGIGWLGVARAIFASWDPLRAVGAALLCGTLFHLSFRLQAWIPPEPLQMMPFAFTILVLAVTARWGARKWQARSAGPPVSPRRTLTATVSSRGPEGAVAIPGTEIATALTRL